jgi:hypothetical protein
MQSPRCVVRYSLRRDGKGGDFSGGLLWIRAEAGENLIVSFIADCVNAKISGQIDCKYFAERMQALKPDIDVAKFQAYEGGWVTKPVPRWERCAGALLH